MTYGRYEKVLVTDTKELEEVRKRHTPIKNQVLASNPAAHKSQVCALDGEDYPCVRIRLVDTVEFLWQERAELLEAVGYNGSMHEQAEQRLETLVSLYEAQKARIAELEERLVLLAEVGESDEQ